MIGIWSLTGTTPAHSHVFPLALLLGPWHCNLTRHLKLQHPQILSTSPPPLPNPVENFPTGYSDKWLIRIWGAFWWRCWGTISQSHDPIAWKDNNDQLHWSRCWYRGLEDDIRHVFEEIFIKHINPVTSLLYIVKQKYYIGFGSF